MNGFLLKMLENSLFTSAAVVLLMLLSRLLRTKTQPKLRYICWLIVALCFLIPVRPSLFAVTIPDDSYGAASGYVDALFRQGGNISDTPRILNAGGQADAPDAIPGEKNAPSEAIPEAYGRDNPARAGAALSYTPAQQAIWPDWIIATVLPCAWILGILLSLAFCAASYARFIRRIRQSSVPVTDSVLNDLLDDICREIGMKRYIGLSICPAVKTPLVAGFFRPAIFLPGDPVDYSELRFMLMHEALHIKTGHMWGKLLSLFAVAVNWFNPAVYLMNRAMLAESELACDAAVLRYAGEGQRMQYGETVFQTAKRSWQSTHALASAFSGSGKNLKRRLSAIVERNTTRRWVSISCAAVLLSGMLLAGLVSCSGDKGNDPDGIVDPIPDAKVDLTPTDELVIYVPNKNYIVKDIDAAVSLYRQTYQNVNVRVEAIGDINDYGDTQQYTDRINSELMSGSGPDIVLVSPHFFPDIYKTMDTGAFLNLSSILEQDEDFRMEDYYQSVLDVGLYKSGRYIVPYSFNMPFLLGLQDQLDAVGFDISKNTGFVPFFNELTACLPKAEENPSFVAAFDWVTYIFGAVHDSGLTLIDYEHKKVLPDEAEFKAFCEAFKPYWGVDDQKWTASLFPGDRVTGLQTGAYLFYGNPLPITNYIYTISEAKGADSAWVLSARRGMDGGVNATMDCALAIRAGSPNQLNAWNFIKTMLSKEIQLGTYQQGPSVYMPVNRKAMSAIIDKTQSQGGSVSFASGAGVTEKWVPAVTSEEKRAIYDLLDGITGCVFWNYTAYDYFLECMTPYFNDEKTYGECVAELKSKLRLYVSE